MKTHLSPPLSIIAIALLLFAGCAHRAVHFAAPDAGPIRVAAGKLSASVTESREAVKAATVAVTKAAASHEAETKRLAALEPKVGDLLRVAPVELRPAVEQIQGEVSALKDEQVATTLALTDAEGTVAIATGKLEEANEARLQVEKLSPTYLAQVEKLTAKANASQLGWEKDSKSLAWYRLHWLIGWVVMIGGILAGVVVWAIKFTVKGAALAARVTARFAL